MRARPFPDPSEQFLLVQLRFGARTLRASLLMTLLTLSVALAFGLLGRWQWQRADDKRLQLSAFAAGSVQQIALGRQPLADLPRFAQVEVHGRYDSAHQFLLDNISHEGRAGYEVLTPLHLDDGRILLVNRGWLAQPNRQRTVLPDIAIANVGAFAGQNSESPVVHLRARIDELPSTGLEAGRAAPATDSTWPKLTSFPTTAELSAALGRAIDGRQLLLAADQPSGYRRDWRPPNSQFGPARHQSYAIQWWSLGALAIVLYFVINLKRS
jgi:surfeit locus 1 family protein